MMTMPKSDLISVYYALWSSVTVFSVVESFSFSNVTSNSIFPDLAIDVPDFLDLSKLRATGLQAGEEELPELTPPIVIPEDTRGNGLL